MQKLGPFVHLVQCCLLQAQEEEGEGESAGPADQEEQLQMLSSHASDSHVAKVEADAAAGTALPFDDDDFGEEEDEVG